MEKDMMIKTSVGILCVIGLIAGIWYLFSTDRIMKLEE